MSLFNRLNNSDIKGDALHLTDSIQFHDIEFEWEVEGDNISVVKQTPSQKRFGYIYGSSEGESFSIVGLTLPYLTTVTISEKQDGNVSRIGMDLLNGEIGQHDIVTNVGESDTNLIQSFELDDANDEYELQPELKKNVEILHTVFNQEVSTLDIEFGQGEHEGERYGFRIKDIPVHVDRYSFGDPSRDLSPLHKLDTDVQNEIVSEMISEYSRMSLELRSLMFSALENIALGPIKDNVSELYDLIHTNELQSHVAVDKLCPVTEANFEELKVKILETELYDKTLDYAYLEGSVNLVQKVTQKSLNSGNVDDKITQEYLQDIFWPLMSQELTNYYMSVDRNEINEVESSWSIAGNLNYRWSLISEFLRTEPDITLEYETMFSLIDMPLKLGSLQRYEDPLLDLIEGRYDKICDTKVKSELLTNNYERLNRGLKSSIQKNEDDVENYDGYLKEITQERLEKHKSALESLEQYSP